MQSKSLSSIINTSTFSSSVQELINKDNRFIRSGIVRKSDTLEQFLNTLDTVTFNEVAARLVRSQQWSSEKLTGLGEIPTLDLEHAIVDRVGTYENRCLDRVIVAILVGICTDSAVTVDVSGNDFVMGGTNFTVEGLRNAQQDRNDLSILAVHSAVYSRIRKNNLLDSKQDPVTGESIATLNGLTIIYHDHMPKIGNVYDSYLCAPGALELAWGNNPKGTEILEGQDDEEILSRSWTMCVHPVGHTYTGFGGPANSVLADPVSWSRQGQVQVIRLRTREA